MLRELLFAGLDAIAKKLELHPTPMCRPCWTAKGKPQLTYYLGDHTKLHECSVCKRRLDYTEAVWPA